MGLHKVEFKEILGDTVVDPLVSTRLTCVPVFITTQLSDDYMFTGEFLTLG